MVPVMSAADPVVDALSEALDGDVPWSPSAGDVLFLRARTDARLAVLARSGWTCQQSFKPFADALGRAGLEVVETAPARRHAAVVVLPPRARDEARALLAQALAHLHADGLLVVAMANNEGARSVQADLERLAGVDGSVSRRRCRVFWSRPRAARIDAALQAQWAVQDELQPIVDGSYVSRPGLFAWDRIDAASALLAAQLPADLAGSAADLGAGYGYLACQLLQRCPGLTALDLYEAEARALAPARANLEACLARCARSVVSAVHWHDVTAGLPRAYDVIVSNPPFHQGRADQPALGQAFIRAAAAALRPHGSLWMVANRHLPYEATLRGAFGVVEARADEAGFKVLRAAEPRP